MRVFPECNAPTGGSLHIIDFSFCAVISRLAFAEFATRGTAQVKLFYCVKMAYFRTIRGKQASLSKENKLLLVHCVSKQPLVLIADGLPSVELEYREVHVSSWIV